MRLMTKVAFITGIAGQDGAYLAQFLIAKGYKVHGLVRWDSYADPLDGLSRLDALGLVSDDVVLHMGDVTDANNLNTLIKNIQPDEIYNLAGLSQVQVSFGTPASTLDINTAGTLNVLDAVRVLGLEAKTKVYQASSSEMFGSVSSPQNEETKMEPCSPYGVAKLAAYHLARTYREAYGMFVCNGILFNHESPRRGETFVTRKITRGLANIAQGLETCLHMGNIDALRDWGHAKDYVRMQWMMLQQEEPDDFVIATGVQFSVREFIAWTAEELGLTLEFSGSGVDEVARVAAIDGDKAPALNVGDVVMRIDPRYFRPAEVETLLGDPSKAKQKLGWVPEITAREMCAEMVAADIVSARRHALLKEHGLDGPVSMEN